MTTEALYHYHAPDNRVYGPANFQKLQEWEKEGRLVATSKLTRKGDREFTTWGQVRLNPPPPPLPAVEPVPPAIVMVTPPNPMPETTTILEEAAKLYRRYFPTLFLCSLAFQFPTFVLSVLFQTRGDLTTLTPSTANKELFFILLAGLLVLLLREVGLGFLTILIDLRQKEEKSVLPQALRKLAAVLPKIVLSLIPRFIFLFFSILPTTMCLGAAGTLMKSGSTVVVSMLLLVMALLFLVPSVLLLLRFLLITQIITLEKTSVTNAFKGSNALIHYNPGVNLLTSGEFRVFLLILVAFALTIPFLLGSVFFVWGDFMNQVNSASTPIHPKLFNLIGSQLMVYLGNSLVSPFFAACFYLFYQYTRQHVPEN